jgi:membrane fusion protein, copper/silver efflux system
VYVERQPGLFEGVEVQLGPRQGEEYPVLGGLNPGDKVAAAGSFLIDAETRLNPAAASTYFGASGGPASNGSPGPASPLQGKPRVEPSAAVAELSEEARKNIEQLPEEDRKAALAQRTCPVTGSPLGSMGVPVKIVLRGQTVFLCCPGCVAKAKRDP